MRTSQILDGLEDERTKLLQQPPMPIVMQPMPATVIQATPHAMDADAEAEKRKKADEDFERRKAKKAAELKASEAFKNTTLGVAGVTGTTAWNLGTYGVSKLLPVASEVTLGCYAASPVVCCFSTFFAGLFCIDPVAKAVANCLTPHQDVEPARPKGPGMM